MYSLLTSGASTFFVQVGGWSDGIFPKSRVVFRSIHVGTQKTVFNCIYIYLYTSIHTYLQIPAHATISMYNVYTVVHKHTHTHYIYIIHTWCAIGYRNQTSTSNMICPTGSTHRDDGGHGDREVGGAPGDSARLGSDAPAAGGLRNGAAPPVDFAQHPALCRWHLGGWR